MKRIRTPHSKKWRRRRKVAIKITTPSGWHMAFKLSPDMYDKLYDAATEQDKDFYTYMADLIHNYLRCLK